MVVVLVGRGRRSIGLAGWAGGSGDAVNPSLAAWPRLARVRCPAHTARPGLGVLPNPPEACLGPMPRTPPPRLRTRPLTVPCTRPPPRERSGKSESKANPSDIPDVCPCRPRPTPTNSRVNLSGARRCGPAGPLAPWMAPSSPMDGFTRPRTVSRATTGKIRKSKTDPSDVHDVRRVDQGRHPPKQDVVPTATGNCRRRGGSGGRGVSRMDAAIELTWTYLQRPLPPDPPRHPTECPLLTLTLI